MVSSRAPTIPPNRVPSTPLAPAIAAAATTSLIGMSWSRDRQSALLLVSLPLFECLEGDPQSQPECAHRGDWSFSPALQRPYVGQLRRRHSQIAPGFA